VWEKDSEATRRSHHRKLLLWCGCRVVLPPITSNVYDNSQKDAPPHTAVRASLGCGNPAALAQLAKDETVLDLGSGGGFDVLLWARRVGPKGKAYGLDMTDEMGGKAFLSPTVRST
jgi:hypothetical protein